MVMTAVMAAVVLVEEVLEEAAAELGSNEEWCRQQQ